MGLKSWIEKELIKRYAGSLIRRGLDLIAGALAVSSIPAVAELAKIIVENSGKFEAALIALVLASWSLLWSFKQKKRDFIGKGEVDVVKE